VLFGLAMPLRPKLDDSGWMPATVEQHSFRRHDIAWRAVDVDVQLHTTARVRRDVLDLVALAVF
jgi:hypothetical protein